MAKKRGNIKVILESRDGIGYVSMRHQGAGGKQTLGRCSFPLADRPAFRRYVSTWMLETHRKMHSPEGASD